MQLNIISVGQKMPQWVEQACDDYIRRMPPELSVKIIPVSLSRRHNNASIDKVRELEAESIVSKFSLPGLKLALDEKGKAWTSKDWARHMESWQMEYSNINLIIGGPDGIAPGCLAICDQKVSLGAMTMPHALVRIVLVEQLYRAWTINRNHPYHRE